MAAIEVASIAEETPESQSPCVRDDGGRKRGQLRAGERNEGIAIVVRRGIERVDGDGFEGGDALARFGSETEDGGAGIGRGGIDAREEIEADAVAEVGRVGVGDVVVVREIAGGAIRARVVTRETQHRAGELRGDGDHGL